MKNLIVRLAHWLLRKVGESPFGVSEKLLDEARFATQMVESFAADGEFKRREAQRVLMNRNPQESAKRINLAIEVVLCEQ